MIVSLGTLAVHLLDEEFAGKFTQENNSLLISKGEKLYKSKGCIACHGDEGNNPASEEYPLLGGQPRKYIEQQIKDIRDENRTNGSVSLMATSISGVTDEEAYMISLYLSDV